MFSSSGRRDDKPALFALHFDPLSRFKSGALKPSPGEGELRGLRRLASDVRESAHAYAFLNGEHQRSRRRLVRALIACLGAIYFQDNVSIH
ncbi:protein of unknown function (plasmid) [Caballeronia sp. S22]